MTKSFQSSKSSSFSTKATSRMEMGGVVNVRSEEFTVQKAPLGMPPEFYQMDPRIAQLLSVY